MSSTNPVKRHIALIGYRGVGKSSVAEGLHHALGYPLVDSDSEIVKIAGKSIPDIFKEDSEDAFRLLESKVIESTCLSDDPVIISTGGGAVMAVRNRELLSIHSYVILLWASEDIIFQRITGDTNRPPLTELSLREEIHRLLKIRTPQYRSIKDFEIDCSSEPVDAIVESIVQQIKSR